MVSKSKRRREARERAANGAGQGSGKSQRTGPKRTAQKKRKQTKQSVKSGSQSLMMSGVDVIGVTDVASKDLVGKALLTFVVNPLSLSGTRLEREARLWARWRPKSLRLEVCPSAGMVIPGGYIAAWSADPLERVKGSGSQVISRLTSFGCQLQNSLGVKGVLNIPCSTTAKWYTLHGEAVDDSHGVILAALAGRVAIQEISAVSITWKLHWTFEFNGPDLPQAAEELLIRPEAGWENVFTDSVSDWAAGKKLTFKHAEGGSVVPWEGVQSGLVYIPTAGVKIPYYSSATAQGEVKFFSRIIDSPNYTSAICCHASEADAIAYQNTGDITKVLDWAKAGEWATPALPTLKGSNIKTSAMLHREPPRQENSSSLEVNALRQEVAELRDLLSQLRCQALGAQSPSDKPLN